MIKSFVWKQSTSFYINSSVVTLKRVDILKCPFFSAKKQKLLKFRLRFLLKHSVGNEMNHSSKVEFWVSEHRPSSAQIFCNKVNILKQVMMLFACETSNDSNCNAKSNCTSDVETVIFQWLHRIINAHMHQYHYL